MWEEIAVKLGMKAVEKFFDNLGKPDNDVVAIGLAVGYFYNFLDPVSDVIRSGELTLTSLTDGEAARVFAAEDVRMQIIVPKRLDVHVFERCEQEYMPLHRGSINLRRNKRIYGINYVLTEMPGRTELSIIDLARPIMSVKRYYEEIVKMDTHGENNEKWLKVQLAAITAFKESLRVLQERGYGVLVNKLDFREIG